MAHKPKVLMLGWEFPPILNGGLGVASYGLTKALSKLVDITLILPITDPNFWVENIEMIGLNNFDIENIKINSTTQRYEFLEHIQIEKIAANLLPYQVADKVLFESTFSTSELHPLKEKLREELEVFKTNDLYDGALGQRVYNFSKMACILAFKKDFDIIHAHDWMTLVAAMEIKSATQKPMVAHIHSLEIDRNGVESYGNWISQIEKTAMEMADMVVAVSQYTANLIKEVYKIPAHKVYAVHNAIDQVPVFRSESSLPEKVVMFLGRVTGQKGPELFMDVATKVLEYIPNVRFVMAGTGNKLKEMIEMGAYKDLGNRFHFTGFLSPEKVRYLLSISDVYVMPSVSEPFGLTALEAAQFGVPCVISNQSGVAEVLTSALKADYWDVDKMSENIISILKYKGLRDQLVKDAYADLAKVSWEKSAAEVYNLYLHHIAEEEEEVLFIG
ncbi:MAG: glycosyltransferase family 4 protein [Cytophagales bacterium]|nr:glycosyltransferase family 4 protein [Cytophagales bacterium]